jgi:hypothetical protein
MGCMYSPSQKIEFLNFNPIPNNRVTPGKVAKYNDIIVILGEKGKIYTNCKYINQKVYHAGIGTWSEDLFQALKLLKLISPEDEKIHGEYLKKETEQRKIINWLSSVRYECIKNPAISINNMELIRLWNELEYGNQVSHKRLKPSGARMKRKPIIKAKT